MLPNSSLDDIDNGYNESEINIPRPIRFWIFLILDILSIYCTFILLFHLFINKNLRSQLTNHVIIILLIIGLTIELIDIPFHLSFLNLGIVQPSTSTMCLIWWFIDIGLYNGSTIIMSFCSIQRYLFIFHDRLFLNRKKRLLFHYLPLILLITYIIIFYIIAIIFPPCINTYDYTLPVCNDLPCYLDEASLGIYDSIVNSILPTMIISGASLAILIRVCCHKHRIQRLNRSRQERKMAIQLISNSILYLIPNIPLSIFIFARLCGLPENVGVEPHIYFDYLCYFVTLLFPFVCLGLSIGITEENQMERLIFITTTETNGCDCSSLTHECCTGCLFI